MLTAPRRQRFCPEPYGTPWRALVDLNRWGAACVGRTNYAVLSFLADRTLVYGKASDSASLQQIVQGVYSRTLQKWLHPGCGLSPSAAKRAVKALVGKGYVKVQRCFGPRGNAASRYELDWIRLHAAFREREHKVGPQGTEGWVHVEPTLGSQGTNSNRRSSSNKDASNNTAPRTAPPVVPYVDSASPKEEVPRTEQHAKRELIELCHALGHILSQGELQGILDALSTKQIDLLDFVVNVRPHLRNPKTRDPVALMHSKIQKYRLLQRPAVVELPPSEHPEVQGCPKCGEQGRGYRMEQGRIVPCECATDAVIRAARRADERDAQRAAASTEQNS